MLEKKNNIHPRIKFLKHFPLIADNVSISSSAKIIGNTNISKNTKILDNVIIRGDGEKIEIGENCLFEKRCTVHVASDLLGTKIGNNCIIEKYAIKLDELSDEDSINSEQLKKKASWYRSKLDVTPVSRE